ncbi:MAG: ATP-binding protein, partial [bacterium]
TTDQQPPTSNHRPATTDQQPPTSNHRPATTDQQPPTSNHRRPTVGQPIHLNLNKHDVRLPDIDQPHREKDMLTEPTNEKLKAMRLDAMAATWTEQAGKPEVHMLAFDERFGMLVDAEWSHRENKRLKTVLRDAKLRLASACIEGIDYPPQRELDRAQIRQLATCRWVVEHQNVLVTGATDVATF